MIQPKWAIAAGLFGAGVATGLSLGWKLWTKATVQVMAQPEIRQKDGSLILKTQPVTPERAKKDVQLLIPRGAKVEGTAQVKLLPHLPTTPTGAPAIPGSGDTTVKPPHEIAVNLALVKMPDGHERVIAGSPDATVTGGFLDLPVSPSRSEKALKWLAGASYNPSDRTYGAFVMRSIGPLEVGVEVNQIKAPVIAGGGSTLDGRITVGIRF